MKTADVFKMFNPIDRPQYSHVINEWVGSSTNVGIIEKLLDDRRRM